MADEANESTTAVAEETKADSVDTRTDFEKSADSLYDKKTEKTEAEATDDKTGDEKKTKPEEKASEDKNKSSSPETYDLQAPEGSLLDESAVERIAAEAKKQGLSQDQAQDLLHRADKIAEDDRDLRERTWRNQVVEDLEIGGRHLAETTTMAQAALERFGSDDLRAMLETTGYGSNPAVIRFLRDIGRAISQDKLVKGSTATDKRSDDRPIEDIIYSKKE